MLFISRQRHIDNDRVKLRIFNGIEHGTISVVHGIGAKVGSGVWG